MSFSHDGERLYSQAAKENLVWSTADGQMIPDAKWNAPNTRTNVTNSGKLVLPVNESIHAVDLNFKYTPREQTYRAFKAKPKQWWHEEQLSASQQAGNQYAATFHAAWLLKLKPDSRLAYETLHTSYDQLDPDVAKLTPLIVAEAMALPRP